MKCANVNRKTIQHPSALVGHPEVANRAELQGFETLSTIPCQAVECVRPVQQASLDSRPRCGAIPTNVAEVPRTLDRDHSSEGERQGSCCHDQSGATVECFGNSRKVNPMPLL